MIFQVTHNIEVSKNIDLYEKLKQLRGNKIGLLNVDGNYRVREISGKEINSRNVLLKPNFSEYSVRKSKCSFEDRYKLVVSEVDDFLDRWKQDKKSKSVIKSGGDDGS